MTFIAGVGPMMRSGFVITTGAGAGGSGTPAPEFVGVNGLDILLGTRGSVDENNVGRGCVGGDKLGGIGLNVGGNVGETVVGLPVGGFDGGTDVGRELG